MKEYDILEANDKYDLLKMINEKAKDNWNVLNFVVIKGTYSTIFYAILEREVEENPSARC